MASWPVEQCTLDLDWRFVSKLWSGSTGYFHFNHVQKIKDELYLTSRNLGAFVVVNLKTRQCYIRTLNYNTPTCVHDGNRYNGKFYFTSIDGKILVASEPPTEFDKSLYHLDLRSETIRLDSVEKNWCRGLEVTPHAIYTTIDGRYGTDLSFSLLALNHEFVHSWSRKLHWSSIGSEKDLRYVTGFDIETQKDTLE